MEIQPQYGSYEDGNLRVYYRNYTHIDLKNPKSSEYHEVEISMRPTNPMRQDQFMLPDTSENVELMNEMLQDHLYGGNRWAVVGYNKGDNPYYIVQVIRDHKTFVPAEEPNEVESLFYSTVEFLNELEPQKMVKRLDLGLAQLGGEDIVDDMYFHEYHDAVAEFAMYATRQIAGTPQAQMSERNRRVAKMWEQIISKVALNYTRKNRSTYFYGYHIGVYNDSGWDQWGERRAGKDWSVYTLIIPAVAYDDIAWKTWSNFVNLTHVIPGISAVGTSQQTILARIKTGGKFASPVYKIQKSILEMEESEFDNYLLKYMSHKTLQAIKSRIERMSYMKLTVESYMWGIWRLAYEAAAGDIEVPEFSSESKDGEDWGGGEHYDLI